MEKTREPSRKVIDDTVGLGKDWLWSFEAIEQGRPLFGSRQEVPNDIYTIIKMLTFQCWLFKMAKDSVVAKAKFQGGLKKNADNDGPSKTGVGDGGKVSAEIVNDMARSSQGIIPNDDVQWSRLRCRRATSVIVPPYLPTQQPT